MLSPIPSGPYHNPAVPQGVHDAIIERITEGTYGPQQHPYVQVAFRLEQTGVYFVTNLYFPPGASQRTERRLWRFCLAVGLSTHDFLVQPDAFIGRRLRLDIVQVASATGNSTRPYHDVKLFLPADCAATANKEVDAV